MSAVTQAVREPFGNVPESMSVVSEAWSMRNPALYTLPWIVVTLAIFAPLAIRQYRRSTLR